VQSYVRRSLIGKPKEVITDAHLCQKLAPAPMQLVMAISQIDLGPEASCI
jgi:hypothetical protein